MQAYHTYGEQGYYAHPQAPQYATPQASYYGQYTPYPPHLTLGQQPFPPYAIPYEQGTQYTPAPTKKKLGRSTSAAPTVTSVPSRSGTPAGPLKSAMKKRPVDRAGSTGSIPLSRQGSRNSEARMRVNSLTRPRTASTPDFVPDHLFLSFHAVNEIRIDNMAYQSTLDELREVVLPMWPHGVTFEDSRDENWRVRFAGSPWTCVGTDAIFAQRMICRMWTVLAHQGYAHLTTVQTGKGRRPPRLVFVQSAPEPESYVFLTVFYPSKMRLSLLDAPHGIAQRLAQSLRMVFPNKISETGVNEHGVQYIEVKKDGYRSKEADRNLFSACMLQFLNSAGFKLDGSIPLGKREPWGMGSQREAWIFRSMPMMIRRPESRQKQ